MLNKKNLIAGYIPVQEAFTRQSEHYDHDDFSNQILINWRQLVYSNIDGFIKPNSRILELNAGTGIDALRMVLLGHTVHATDYAPGMIKKINQKIFNHDLLGRFTSQQCSFETLNLISEKKFDYVISNFGGLNCCKDLTKVTNHLASLLNPGAFVTWVIMPKISPWEFLRFFKGRKSAFRRLKSEGTMAHLEGKYFKTYYHSLQDIKEAFGKDFTFLKCEGLGIMSPPPASISFSLKYPAIYSFLKNIDRIVKNTFPFNRWGDHIIVTFQYKCHEGIR